MPAILTADLLTELDIHRAHVAVLDAQDAAPRILAACDYIASDLTPDGCGPRLEIRFVQSGCDVATVLIEHTWHGKVMLTATVLGGAFAADDYKAAVWLRRDRNLAAKGAN